MKTRTFGLDIGITSVGYAVIDSDESGDQLIDFGTRKFEEASKAGDRRAHRSSNRNTTRKRWRLNQIKRVFSDYGILEKELLDDDNFLSYTTKNLVYPIDIKKYPTIYHLRKAGLEEKLTLREVFLTIYHLAKTRGFFYLENIDFTKETIKNDELAIKIVELLKTKIMIENASELQKFIEKSLLQEKLKSTEFKKHFDGFHYAKDEENDKLREVIKLLAGYKAKMVIIDENYSQSMDILGVKTNEKNDDFLNELITIYDQMMTVKVMENYDYLAEKHVAELDRNRNLFNDDKLKKAIKDKNSKKRLRIIKNTENNYPNGLYVKEAIKILKTQQKYYSQITDEFIKIIVSVIKAKIPYYIGPLAKNGNSNFSWINFQDSNTKFKYSYQFSNDLVDESSSIEEWKKRMISHCSYLVEEEALPKQSFLSELVSIVNELNIRSLFNESDEKRHLTKKEKIAVLNQLFLKNKEIKFNDVAELLNEQEFGNNRNAKINQSKFNKSFTIYHQIKEIVPELEIKNIEQELQEMKKINLIEEIIGILNIFEDETNKNKELKKVIQIDDERLKRLAKLSTKDFASLSRKFIFEQSFDENGLTLLELLLQDSDGKEQMYYITNAKDSNQKPLDLSANKYIKKLEQNDCLDYQLLVDGTKAFMAISRPVLRSLNQTLIIYNALVEEYGEPDKVVIETARDLADSSRDGKVTNKFSDEMKISHQKLIEQVKKYPKTNLGVEKEFAEIEKYLTSNRRKVQLYLQQNGHCLLTGKKIDLNQLHEYQEDHILPKGFGDNSFDNMMLIVGSENNKKQDNLPLEYIRKRKPEKEKEFKIRVEELFKLKTISEAKYKRLLLEDQEQALGFIERNLVDTRYIIKEFGAILKAYYQFNDLDIKLSFIPGRLNSNYRYAFDFAKNRELGDAHHAEDAGLAIVIDQLLNYCFPNYQQRKITTTKKSKATDRYKEFLNNYINSSQNRYSKNAQKNNLQAMFYYAKKINFDNDVSIITQLKNNRCRISYKVEKKTTGQLFNLTILPSKIRNLNSTEIAKVLKYFIGEDVEVYQNLSDKEKIKKLCQEVSKKELDKYVNEIKKQPLDILGVNNHQKNFESVESCAIDFYKVAKKVKNKYQSKYYIIHIPKIIVDDQGKINQEKYLKLIKEHYRADDLIDKNGNLITKRFRFRAFKNDLIYDTKNYEPVFLAMGSIVNKTMEFKQINIMNFKENDNLKELISKKLQAYYNESNQKMEIPEGAIERLKDLIKQRYNYYLDREQEKILQDSQKIIEDTKIAVKDKIIKLVRYFKIMDGKYSPAKPTGVQIIVSANNNVINNKDNPDAEYVKVKYSPLGVKINFENKNINVISEQHQRIKKEEFTLQIK